MKRHVADRLSKEFGTPVRDIKKVKAWTISNAASAVLQMDQPSGEDYALVWLPYPSAGQPVPETALEYAGESGRHSNTYPSPGLERGKPALKLRVRTSIELEETIAYIRAFAASMPLPEVHIDIARSDASSQTGVTAKVDAETLGRPEPKKPRREAIARAVQREVWQRDGGVCVECGSRELLCFDHIVPFSRGGSNTVRNIQLLCEPCNLSKGNRL